MKPLYVYADFDWLKEIALVGELGYESLRGLDSYSFAFHDEWLRVHGDLFLSEDLNNYPGIQYTRPGDNIFKCFSDALPDRWGRTLLLRREQIAAAEENRPIRRLSSFDFLTGIDDFSRMGGFRFKEKIDGDFINAGNTLKIPPLAKIRDLIAASVEIEKSEEDNVLPDRKWVAQLVQPGSSLGGARPKASVCDADKTLYIAKFPSRKDDYDVGLWEHFSHLLAVKAGIKVKNNDIKEAARRTTREQFAQYGMNLPEDVVEKYAEETLKKGDQIERLIDDVIDNKLIDSYKGIMTLEHKSVTLDEFNKLLDKK